MITLLVVVGIALLIAIGYMNHVVENNKLEKARTKIELNDRLRRCGEITETFPGQLMTPALKLLLARLELNVCQRLLNLEKTSANLRARITELEALAVLCLPSTSEWILPVKDTQYSLVLLLKSRER